jgi:hypothetical protein
LPIIESNIIENGHEIFLNFEEILALHQDLKNTIVSVTSAKQWITFISKIYLKYCDRFRCYINYGSNQMFAKDAFEVARQKSSDFSQFIQKAEGAKECRRLPFSSFLQRPVTRLGRYPLLLDAILKRLDPDSAEFKNTKKLQESIKNLLTDINSQTGIRANIFKLQKLQASLVYKEMVRGFWDCFRNSFLLIIG